MPRDTTTHRRSFIKGAIGTGLIGGLAGCQGDEEVITQTETDSGNGNGNGSGDSGSTNAEKPTPDEGEEDNYEPVGALEWIGMTRGFSTERFTTQELLQEDWGPLGLDLELRTMEIPQIIERWVNEDFDLMTLFFSARTPRLDPHVMLWFDFHSEAGDNHGKYYNPQYDEVSAAMDSEYDEARRIELAHKCQEILARDQPYIFLYHTNSLAAANTDLFSNWREHVGTWVYWGVDNLRSITPNGDEDTVVFGTSSAPTTVNPMGLQGNAAQQAAKMFTTRLVRWSADGGAVPWAADSIDAVDDTTVDVQLKDGLTFHDGTDITADDVKFTMDYYREHGVPDLSGFYENVDSVEVQGDLTTRFNLDQPSAPFTTVSLSMLGILPEHVWSGVTDEEGLEHPKDWGEPDYTGGGPFKLIEYTQGSRIVYETYDDYQLADFDFDRLVWDIYGNNATAVGDLENNRISFVQNLQASSYERLNSASNVKAVANKSHGVTSIRLNNQSEPLNDVVFRQALAHATNKQRLIDIALSGFGDLATNTIAPANKKFYKSGLPAYAGGTEKAIEILRNAGYRWDENGTLLKPLDRFSGEGPPRFGDQCDTEGANCYPVDVNL